MKPKSQKNNSAKKRKEDIAIDRGIHRETMIEMGMYNIHKQKEHKDKSKYTRAEKHRKPPKDE